MKVRGPLITLAAVAVLGAGILLVNFSNQTAPSESLSPTWSPPSLPYRPSSRLRRQLRRLPAKADSVGKVPTANGAITVEITVKGNQAVAYGCDGSTVESWLRGPAVNGTVSLANRDKTSRLEGHLQGAAVVGTR